MVTLTARLYGPHKRLVKESGVVLFVALIVLIVMTLAGLAMMRQMGAGVSIAGNMAFKENATSVADSGTEAARAWFVPQTALALSSDSPTNGYYSSWGTSIDPTMFDWSAGHSVAVTLDAGTGNSVRYVIHRLCAFAGRTPDDPTQRCSDSVASNAGSTKGGGSYGGIPLTPVAQPFFRVTTRVEGPRNTVSYIQVVTN
jgi:type IV pilus assembly protein PilX